MVILHNLKCIIKAGSADFKAGGCANYEHALSLMYAKTQNIRI